MFIAKLMTYPRGMRFKDIANTMEKKSLPPFIKLVAVGDRNTGKTCLLHTYATKSFPQAYVPSVFDEFSTNIEINGATCILQLWDTAGQKEYSRPRHLSYPHTCIFLILFDVSCWKSFDHVKSQ